MLSQAKVNELSSVRSAMISEHYWSPCTKEGDTQLSSQAAVNSHHTSTDFLELPPELRISIYEHLFSPSDQEIRIRNWSQSTAFDRHEPPILQTCHWIREEALHKYYSLNKFVIHVNTAEIENCCHWLRARSGLARNKQQPFGSIRFHVQSSSWNDSFMFRRLAQLVHETGIELNADTSEPLFELGAGNDVEIGHALMDAVDLGRRGRREGWNRESVLLDFILGYNGLKDEMKNFERRGTHLPRSTVQTRY